MSWKQNIQLGDLEPTQRLELTCLKCCAVSFTLVADLLKQEGFKYRYLDELETHLSCSKGKCRGCVRLAINDTSETEGFSGGLA